MDNDNLYGDNGVAGDQSQLCKFNLSNSHPAFPSANRPPTFKFKAARDRIEK